jgi:hypothetical protein
MFKDLEQWAAIRRAVLEEGVSLRQIRRETGLHWDTIKRIMAHETPPAFGQQPTVPTRQAPPTQAELADPTQFIDRILQQDRLLGWADRHTPKQIWTILHRAHGCDISLEAVRRHVDRRTGSREVLWDEVSALLGEILGAGSKETVLALLPIDPRGQPVGTLRRLPASGVHHQPQVRTRCPFPTWNV